MADELIAQQRSEDEENGAITTIDEAPPKYSYPLLIDEEYPIKLVFTAYEIDFTKSKQWDAIERETNAIRDSFVKGAEAIEENPIDTGLAAAAGGLTGLGIGSIAGRPKTGAAIGALTSLAAATDQVGEVAGSLGTMISEGAKLTSYDNYSASTDPKGTVVLPLQRGLQYSDKVSYTPESTNFGQGIISAATSFLSGEDGKLSEAAAGGVGRLAARAAGAGVGAALGKVAGVAGLGAIAGGFGAGPLESFAKEVSRVSMNPNLRTLFDNVPMRAFSFPFRMIAKSEKEAQEIRNIVKFFRGELYPEAVNVGENNNIPFAYKFPNVFDIQLKDSTGKNPAFKIQRCYLTGVNTTFNQTATGMYKGNDGNYFIEVDMSLEFIEIVTMDKAKVEEGGF